VRPRGCASATGTAHSGDPCAPPASPRPVHSQHRPLCSGPAAPCRAQPLNGPLCSCRLYPIPPMCPDDARVAPKPLAGTLPLSVALHFAGAPCTLHPTPGWRIAHARAGSGMMSVSAQVCTILRGPTRWTTSAARSGDEVRCDSSPRPLVIEKHAAVIFRSEPRTNVDDNCPCITTALHNSWTNHQRVEETRHDMRENPQGNSAECAAQT
jgi:hypothetical protein